MKQEIKTTEAIFPMPVLMISTFNEDGRECAVFGAWSRCKYARDHKVSILADDIIE